MKPPNRSRISAVSPVQGLARRQLSFLPVFAQAVAAVAPAGAMSVIPALALGVTGPALLLAFAAAMVIMVLVSAAVRPMAKRMAAVSGLYSYIAKGLGPMPALVGGWSAIFGYGLVASACMMAVGMYLDRAAVLAGFAPSADPMVMILILMVAAGLAAAVLMVRGIRVSAGVTLLVEGASILIFTVLMTVYLWRVIAEGADLSPAFRWDGNLQSFSVGIVVAVSAFVGFESSTTLGGEARKTFQSIPRVLRWTPIATGALYLCAVTAQQIALASAPPGIASSSTPLSDLFSLASPAMAAVLDVGIAASFFACTIASVTALARILFCMGRERVAPVGLGLAHGRFRTPYIAILTSVPAVVLVPGFLVLAGVKPEQILTQLFILGAYGYLGSYLLASLATPIFLAKIGESTPMTWGICLLSSLLCLGAVSWTALGSASLSGPPLGLVYLAVVLCAMLFTIVLRATAPGRLAEVGIYDETRESDLLQAPFRGGRNGR